MNRPVFPLLIAATVAGCADLPRDPEGTTERVRAERRFRVGMISGGDSDARAFLTRVESATHAKPAVEQGAAESLLAKLADGGLDLVIGPMAPKSPWEKQVHFLPALEEEVTTASYRRVVPMARNGENRWIALLDAAARP